MKKVCVDTNMLIWYIKRQCTQGQEDCLVKAEYLFNYFQDKNIEVVIPSLVVAELLGNVEDEDEREGYFDYMSENFQIAQHDVLSARKFAELRLKLTKANEANYAKGNTPKCQITNDYNICSVALSSGCDAIFSHNLKDFEKFVEHQIPIYTLDYVEELKRQDEAFKLSQRNNNIQVSLFHNQDKEDKGNDDEDMEVKIQT